jgi:hypothetical protein
MFGIDNGYEFSQVIHSFESIALLYMFGDYFILNDMASGSYTLAQVMTVVTVIIVFLTIV